MALTSGLDHEFLATVFSSSTIQEQANIGNISQDDADLAISLGALDVPTAFEEAGEAFDTFSRSLDDTITGEIDQVSGQAIDLLFGLDDKIRGWILDALGPAIDLIESIPQRVVNAVAGVADTVTGIVSTLEDTILNPVLSTLVTTINMIGEIDDRVKDVVSVAVAPITAVSNTILDKVEGFATALRDTIPSLGETLVAGFAGPIEGLTAGLETGAKLILEGFFGDISQDVADRLNPIIELFEEELSLAPELGKLTAPGLLQGVPVVGLIAGLALPMIFSNIASTALSPFTEKLRQRMNSLVKPSLIGATDAIQAEQRGFMTSNRAGEIMDRHGFPFDDQTALFETIKLRPGTMDIIDFWRREIFDDGQATTELRNLGWDERYIDILKQAAFPPPGVQDLIRMAVREVFSPEIAEQFGQFEEIPPAFISWAKQIGLSEEWATNYWAAHWVLPSVQQGFEMLHRGVITDEDVERLFVALDVMPFWRTSLKAISFRPYTRVDVRRMFAFGVLDKTGVRRAYLDLGFDKSKADNMTEFTVRWVESTRKVEKEKERDLTKADIIGLFNDGLLDESTTRTHLESMGYDSNEAELLVSREIMQEMRSDRKADIQLIIDQAKIKVLSFSDAQDRLNGLDLTRKELERAMIDVTRATTQRTRLPSKSDLDTWRELKLISPDRYVEELDNLGFPAKYVALYAEASELEEAEDLLAAEEREAKKVEPRNLTKGNLDSLLRTEIIDETGYINGLENLRYSPSAINDFLAQITIQIEERRIADAERIARGEEAAEKEKLLSRVVLGKLLIKGLIDVDAYQEGLVKLGFGVESVELLIRLMQQKLAAETEEEGT